MQFLTDPTTALWLASLGGVALAGLALVLFAGGARMARRERGWHSGAARRRVIDEMSTTEITAILLQRRALGGNSTGRHRCVVGA